MKERSSKSAVCGRTGRQIIRRSRGEIRRSWRSRSIRQDRPTRARILSGARIEIPAVHALTVSSKMSIIPLRLVKAALGLYLFNAIPVSRDSVYEATDSRSATVRSLTQQVHRAKHPQERMRCDRMTATERRCCSNGSSSNVSERALESYSRHGSFLQD